METSSHGEARRHHGSTPQQLREHAIRWTLDAGRWTHKIQRRGRGINQETLRGWVTQDSAGLRQLARPVEGRYGDVRTTPLALLA